ncbi:MAG: aldehyde dehydrogenase family protein [Gammaproteobacteria bacterium]|nr:aldehyde dehydrogenase family protein [Gammaproteobacteria bacterium]
MHTQPEKTGPVVVVRNPASGAIIGEYAQQSADAVRAAIRAARTAQPDWAAQPLRERQRCIARLRNLLLEQLDELARTIADCVGKTRVEALATEIMPAVGSSRWYEKHAPEFLRGQHLKNGSLLFFNKHSTLRRLPWGVVGIISPWNYPLGIPMHEIVPALLAGNAVIFKTAPETLPVGVKITQLLQQARLPADVFHHVNIDGPLCGDLFLEHGGVDKLFFTGSVRVGKQLMEKAANTLTPLSLELGGKDAMIVCADADLERAAGGAVWAGLSNAGQSCAGVERLYVHQDIYTPFMALLRQKVAALRVGPDADFSVDVGAICTERQVATIKQHLHDALRHGAAVFAQAKPPAGGNPRFIPPTVLTQVDHSMVVMREETFGPVIGVMPFASDMEAVRLANDSVYGLSASVWSQDLRRAARLAGQIRAGAVTINDHLLSHGLTETPWGGHRDSGNGRGHGRFAFEAVTTPQVIVNDWLKLIKRQPFWMPYDARGYQGLKGILTALYGSGMLRRLSGLRQFARLLPRMLGRG